MSRCAPLVPFVVSTFLLNGLVLWVGTAVFASVLLGGCGVLGEPIPYTSTQAYRKRQEENAERERAEKEKNAPEAPEGGPR